MRFTIYTNPQTQGPEGDLDQIDLSIEQAIRATEAGFDGIALTEHHASGYNTFGDNVMMAAHLAPQVRKGVRFVLAILVPPLHHPMRLAQQCNLIDLLTRGNVIIGMGAGGSPLEYHSIGRDPKRRHDHMMEVLDVLERLLAFKPGDPPVPLEDRLRGRHPVDARDADVVSAQAAPRARRAERPGRGLDRAEGLVPDDRPCADRGDRASLQAVPGRSSTRPPSMRSARPTCWNGARSHASS